MLKNLVEMERRNGFRDGTLPLMRISGCMSSCSAQQLGSIGIRGCQSIDGEPAYMISVNGSHILGRERIGTEIGAVKTAEIPAFFEAVGKAVEASGKKYREWFNEDPEAIVRVGERFLHRK